MIILGITFLLCATAIVMTHLIIRAATKGGREEELHRKITKWSDDIKGRLVDVELEINRLRLDWAKWKEGK